MTRPTLPLKLYYRIGEVAEVVGVETHVLRYWESEFSSIRPQKSPKGQRVYSRKDLEKLLLVKELLYTQGYTVAGAKKRLRELTRAGLTDERPPVVESREGPVPERLSVEPRPAEASLAPSSSLTLRRGLEELRELVAAELESFRSSPVEMT